MNAETSARAEMLKAIPTLRAYAISLCRNAERADDLVQETLARAWSNIGKFQPGSGMLPWLTTILRNSYYSEYRKHHRVIDDPDGVHASILVSLPEQMGCVEWGDMQEAITALPEEMRNAILLVGALGYSYEEAARKSGCALGTIKSRVHRARACLEVKFQSDRPTSRKNTSPRVQAPARSGAREAQQMCASIHS